MYVYYTYILAHHMYVRMYVYKLSLGNIHGRHKLFIFERVYCINPLVVVDSMSVGVNAWYMAIF